MFASYWRRFTGQRNGMLLSFMSLSFFSGMGSALFVPVLSLFLTNKVHVEPFAVGLFYTVNAIGGIIFSQIIARYSDRHGRRKQIIMFCFIMGALNCLLFDWCRSYLLLITAGVVLMSIGSSAMPQTFALARDYKDQSGERSVMFTSVMRTQLSLAWVIGPAVAFGIVAAYGFKTLFMGGMAIYLIALAIAYFKLPLLERPKAATAADRRNLTTKNIDVLKLFIASTLMWGCNSMYIISMPLYVGKELHLPQELAGWMMGTAAALEIPLMLVASYLTKFWRIRNLLIIACLAGVLFYVGMNLVTTPHLLIAIQLGNAAFIGILGGLGMVYFQDLMPGRSGQATTLFSNSLYTGNVIAGGLAGMIAQYFGYGAIFWVGGVFVAAAAIALCLIRTKVD